MPRQKGCGPRIAERIKALGFIMPNGKEDVPRFSMRHRFDKSMVYEWVSDRSTPEKHMGQLAKTLQTTVAYLLLGIEAPPPVAAPAPNGRARRAPNGRRRQPSVGVDGP